MPHKGNPQKTNLRGDPGSEKCVNKREIPKSVAIHKSGNEQLQNLPRPGNPKSRKIENTNETSCLCLRNEVVI